MSKTSSTSKTGKESSSQAKYHPPKLREFGSVGKLTQGGTGNMVEGSMGMGGMMGGTNNPNRRP